MEGEELGGGSFSSSERSRLSHLAYRAFKPPAAAACAEAPSFGAPAGDRWSHRALWNSEQRHLVCWFGGCHPGQLSQMGPQLGKGRGEGPSIVGYHQKCTSRPPKTTPQNKRPTVRRECATHPH